jgi:hypothetical protein
LAVVVEVGPEVEVGAVAGAAVGGVEDEVAVGVGDAVVVRAGFGEGPLLAGVAE